MATTEKTEVTLATSHMHKGREFARGDVLTLRPDQAEWLIAKGRAVKKGDALPALDGEIKTVSDMREVEAAVAEAQRAKTVAAKAKG